MKHTNEKISVLIPTQDIEKLEAARKRLHKLLNGTKLKSSIPFGITDIMYKITHKKYEESKKDE